MASVKPRYMSYNGMNFLIFEEPSDDALPDYVQEFKAYNVRHIVAACKISYDKRVLEEQGYIHHVRWPVSLLSTPLNACARRAQELPFTDGAAPPNEVIDAWIELVFAVFAKKKGASEAIGIHCAAGLGRAPVLVSIALIEGGTNPLEAVSKVREACPGAINTHQIHFLRNYKRRHSKKCSVQ
eukprot:TRINITY_DN5706_c0_g1_i1.p1 TRINITY_DN5706_c0_g1~~TRINITY_DN5706_c0_g1_i1.p1  ORF type:complete len:183 (+),score=59.06 TRINITY_DN5706_c0_g1_i1:51-599(+)